MPFINPQGGGGEVVTQTLCSRPAAGAQLSGSYCHHGNKSSKSLQQEGAPSQPTFVYSQGYFTSAVFSYTQVMKVCACSINPVVKMHTPELVWKEESFLPKPRGKLFGGGELFLLLICLLIWVFHLCLSTAMVCCPQNGQET